MVILRKPILRFAESVKLTSPPGSEVISSGKHSQLAHLWGCASAGKQPVSLSMSWGTGRTWPG
jgi:hypothetical protein